MVTAASVAMAQVVARIQPVLKAAGFNKRAHTFNRVVEPGVVQVVALLMGRPLPPGTAELPGLRENLHGLFAVELGVFIEEAWRLEERFGPEGRPAAKSWVNDYDCQLRRSVANPDGESTHLLWPLEAPDVAAAVLDALHADALPWLDNFSSRTAILAALEGAPVDSYDIAGESPDRLLATRMRLAAGDRERAQEHLDAWLDHCSQQAAADPRMKHHLAYLAEFADRVGLNADRGRQA